MNQLKTLWLQKQLPIHRKRRKPVSDIAGPSVEPFEPVRDPVECYLYRGNPFDSSLNFKKIALFSKSVNYFLKSKLNAPVALATAPIKTDGIAMITQPSAAT